MSRSKESSKNTNSTAVDSLTVRERECLLWCALGNRTKQIADKLRITPNTANEYIGSALKKLGASSRAEAATILLAESYNLPAIERRFSRSEKLDNN